MTEEQRRRQDDAAFARLDSYLERTARRMLEQSGDEAFRSAVHRVLNRYDHLGKADRRRLLTILTARAIGAIAISIEAEEQES